MFAEKKKKKFKRLMAAESSFVLAFRQRNIDAVGSGSYYENSSGLKSPLQAWQSPRPVEFGSRFTNSTEPSHPFKYLVDQVCVQKKKVDENVYFCLFFRSHLQTIALEDFLWINCRRCEIWWSLLFLLLGCKKKKKK